MPAMSLCPAARAPSCAAVTAAAGPRAGAAAIAARICTPLRSGSRGKALLGSSRGRRYGSALVGVIATRASMSEEAPPVTEEKLPTPPPPTPPPNPAPAEGTPPFTVTLGLGAVGAVETAYLLATKLAGGSAACPTDGCEAVLSSSYATLYGLPLPAFGLAAYLAVVAVSALGRQQVAEDPAGTGGPAKPALLFFSAAMASTSAYLMFVLFTQLGGDCLYCFTSAGLSAALFTLAAGSVGASGMGRQALPLVAVVAATILTVANGSAPPDVPQFIEYRAPVVSTTSSARAVEVAERLSAVGAKMYGAFWCSHCAEQKQILGAQAMKSVTYVECYPDGWERGKAMDDACVAASLEGFPTWVIGGERLEGDKSVAELEKAVAKAEAAMAAPATAQ